MRRAALVVVLVACRTHVDLASDRDAGAVALPPPSESVVAAPPPPSASVPPPPSASAQPPPLPTSVSAIPAAWLACAKDSDCVAIPSACCGSWPSNVASRDRVHRAVTAADAARDNCKNRMCAMRMETAACESGRCVVR